VVDEPKRMRGLRIAMWVLFVPAAALSAVYLKGAVDPPAHRDGSDFVSNGAPVFFITLVLLFLAVRKPDD
jgi:hypothetical protein